MKTKNLYEEYFKETRNADGEIDSIDISYNSNFNFAYDVFDVIARETPERRAMVHKSLEGEVRTFTFGQLSALSNKMANVMKKDGLGRGDSVMLILNRRYEFWIAILALHKLGAVTIPTSHLVEAGYIRKRLDLANIKAIVSAGTDEICATVEEACGKLNNKVINYIVGDIRPGYIDIKERMENESDEFFRVKTCVTDPMLYYFTSGTTGDPKAVIHDYSYPIAHIMTAKNWQGVEEDGLHFTMADSGWAKSAWGKLYGQWFLKSAIMVYDYENFYANEILSLLEEEKVTTFCAPPTIYKYLVREDLSKYDLSSLKQAATAGEPMPTEVAKKFHDKTGLTIREGFGQTETVVLTCIMVGKKPKEGSIGKPVPLYHTMIVDEDNKEVPVGETGEIVILPNDDGSIPVGVFKGYLGAPDLYKEVWEGGVYHTKDKAYRDMDGYYYFVSRNDDVIKSSGYRIGPSEVEDILMKHPAVFECAVTGYPSKTRGSIVKASIVLNEGYTGDSKLVTELQDFVKEHDAVYKYPRKIEFVDDLPRTVTGKISRKMIREADLKKLEEKGK